MLSNALFDNHSFVLISQNKAHIFDYSLVIQSKNITFYPIQAITISKRFSTVYKGEKIMVVSSYFWKRGKRTLLLSCRSLLFAKRPHTCVSFLFYFSFVNHPIPICITLLKPANIMIACIRVPKSMRAVFYPKTCLGFVAPLKRKKFLWLLLSKQ